MFPEIYHIETDVLMVVPVHEDARAKHDAGDVAKCGCPVADFRNEHGGDHDIDR